MEERRTQVLNVLISQQGDCDGFRALSRLDTGAVCLEDHNSICSNCRDEGGSVAELRPRRVVVESDVGEEISKDAEE